MSHISRRRMLSVAGLAVGSGIIATQSGCGNGTPGFAASSPANSPPADNDFRPRYIPISADETAARAYHIYPEGSCMYAVVKSIVTMISDKDPSAVPPMFFDMFKYGHGGCGAWGTLCGCCNGGAAVIGLFHQDKKTRDGLIGQLFRWYESTELPRFVPATAENDDFPKTQTDSVLCHVSMNSWCVEAEESQVGAKRKERCRRVAGDVARKVVELLNTRHAEEKAGKQVASNEPPTPRDVASQPPHSCIQCHAPGGEKDSDAARAPESVTKMDCSICHDKKADHPD